MRRVHLGRDGDLGQYQASRSPCGEAAEAPPVHIHAQRLRDEAQHTITRKRSTRIPEYQRQPRRMRHIHSIGELLERPEIV